MMNLLNNSAIRRVLVNVRSFACVTGNRFATMPSITVSPASSYIYEPVNITVSGVAPNSPVSIQSTMKDRKKVLGATAHFVADSDGRLDLNKQESLGGSYSGLEPMGLFWSLRPVADGKPGYRFVKLDLGTPSEYTFSVYSGHPEKASLSEATPLAVTKIQKWFMKEGEVERIKVHSGRLRGSFFKPKGPGPFPALIDLTGVIGILIDYRAALLASKGFATFALPYYDYEGLPRGWSELQFEYFEEAFNWLSAQACVNPSRIGINSICIGASLGLEMACRIPQIKATIAVSSVPAVVVPLTYKGKRVISSHPFDTRAGYMTDTGYVMKDIKPPVLSEIPREHLCSLENSKGHFLFMWGEEDLISPAVEGAKRAEEKLQYHGKDNYEFVSYPGAGHILEPPYQPISRSIYNPPLDVIFDLGGELKAQAHGCEDSWARTLSFFHKHLVVGGDTAQDRPSGEASNGSKL